MASSIDFSPLLRSMIGFDRLSGVMENAFRHEPSGYPHYNIELTGENHYRITMAVAGFTEENLNIETKENVLTITGTQVQDPAGHDDARFLHRGIAQRNFERKFQLADYVRVADASLEHGLLHINLVREVPETMKPRKISIGTQKLIEGQKEQG